MNAKNANSPYFRIKLMLESGLQQASTVRHCSPQSVNGGISMDEWWWDTAGWRPDTNNWVRAAARRHGRRHSSFHAADWTAKTARRKRRPHKWMVKTPGLAPNARPPVSLLLGLCAGTVSSMPNGFYVFSPLSLLIYLPHQSFVYVAV